jgi:beta-glucosidase
MIRTPFVVLLAAAALLAQAPHRAPYWNPDLPPQRRAADLVSRMTLEEKVLQMQNTAPAIERLGVPAYDWWNEALHGVARAGDATVFPQAIGLAATWDTALMHRVADIISTEARAKYNYAIRHNDRSRYHGLTFWSPNINIFRDPRWGRGQETYGEDPYLTGQFAIAFIRGMQGGDPHYFKVIATAKHYGVHSGPEPERHQFDVHPSERDLNDTYLPAFRAAILQGKADSIMCAYNAVDGVPACANTELLQHYLRKEWGFQGYVVSDCGAIRDIYEGHHYKANAAEASAAAVKAGTDLTCGTEYRSLVEAVHSGLIDEKEIDHALESLFVARFQLGMFDPPARVPFSRIPDSEVDSAAHRQVALEAARESIVLLKNADDILPLKPSVRRIAVIGASADDPDAPMGNYNGFSKMLVTPLAGMRAEFRGKAQIRYALGATYTSHSHTLVPSSALAPPNGKGHGLLAEYFANPNLEGRPKLTRVDSRPRIQPDMMDPAMAAVLPPHGYSVRWTGTLTPPFTGDYALAIKGNRHGLTMSRVFVDGAEILPSKGTLGVGRVQEMHRTLQAGHAYRLRIEYKEQGPAMGAEFLWTPPAGPLLDQAMAAVKDADVIVACVGLDSNLEGEEMPVDIPGFKGGDRTSLDLPATQQRLVEAAMATGKPVVVVLTSGSALSVKQEAEHAAAVLEAWYAGEEGGAAIAETLAGANNPAGRLPVTFYRSVGQLPPFEDYSMDGRTYRYFKGDPLWGFGFGLSYSKFTYSGLRARHTPAGAAVSVHVKNVSGRAGDEVVELYVSGGDAIRSLRGFQRVHLVPGESRSVDFTIPAEDLPKKAEISVGGGQPIEGIAHLTTSL